MSDSSEEESGGFKINEAYASKYNEWRRREEMQKLRDRYGVDAEKEEEDSSSSESEDEDAEALTAQVEEDWLKTLAALKSKDPRIYDKSVKFYHTDEEDSDSSTEKPGPSKKKDKPVYLKDYHRKVILEKDGKISDEESDEIEEDEIEHEPGYYEEQEKIKRSFKAKLAEESGDSDEELFTTRSKTREQEEEEEKDYIKWLKDQKDLEEENPVGVELASLKSYWNDPKLNANEKFLRDLILNKGYIDKDSKRLPSYSEIVDEGEGFSEEEELLEREDQFERKYNFRFEEPDADFIKSYPRTVKDSLRQTSSKRSEKRQDVKKRKEMEKQKVKEEIKQLKNMKRREIMDKIDQLREITGDPELEFQEEDLETDFDPQKHDEMMKKYFNDDFYKMDEGEQKPEAPEDIEDLQCENWDEWAGGEGEEYNEDYDEDYQAEDYQEDYEPHADDPDFCMDDDYDPTAVVSKKKSKKKRSKFAQAVTSTKPTFDPKEKTFEEYFDEYYKLDYEDIVGGQPCRFKYRRVTPNSYGLGTNEILKCRDKELNAWVSVKKMSQYRTTDEEEREVKIFESKGKNDRKKKNILLSLKEEAEEQAKKQRDTAVKNTSGKAKKRKHDETDVNDGKVKKSKKEETKSQVKSELDSPKKIQNENLFTIKVKKEKPENESGKISIKSEVISASQTDNGKISTGSKESDSGLSKKQRKRRRRKAAKEGDTISIKKEVSDNDIADRLSGGLDVEEDIKPLTTEKSGNSHGMSEVKLEGGKGKGKRKRNRKKKKKEGGPPKLSSERLLAFGINPKKVQYMNFNKLKGQS